MRNINIAATLLVIVFAWILAASARAADPPYRLRFAPSGLQMDRISGGQADTLLRSIQYEAYSSQKLAFRTTSVRERKTLQQSTQITFTLEGPSAAQASVTAVITPQAGSIRMKWTIHFAGPAQEISGGQTGFRMGYAQPVLSAATLPTTWFIRPVGNKSYEVKGDTPYRDMEWQLREVSFAKSRLIVATKWYDPDWIYGHQLARAAALPAGFSKESPTEATYEFALVPLASTVPSIDALGGPAADVAAAAAGRPLSLSVQCPHAANLFVPGETARFNLRLHNVAGYAQRGRLKWNVWDYYGKRLAGGTGPITLAPDGSKQVPVVLRNVKRGMLFLDATLAAGGQEWVDRTTFGILPAAPSYILNPQSAFGIAGIIGDPNNYPDQKAPDEVLAAAHRIGARWIRLGAALGNGPENPELHLLAKYGLSGHVQIHTNVPAPDHAAEFSAQLKSTLQRLQGQSSPIEVGNELNLAGVSPQEYVDRLLRPVHKATRELLPRSEILSMGLGGVEKKWLDGFVAAGGMDLVDVLSVHPGCQPRAPEYWKGSRGWVFRPQVLDALQAAGPKPLWLSETYAPTPPDRSQLDVRTAADYLVRTYLVSLALGVKVVEWYQLQDGIWFAQRPNPADTEYNYGLLYTDLTPKPGYIAYAAMTEQLEGAHCQGRLELGADDLYGLHFNKGQHPLEVLWSYREKHETDLEWWPPEQFKDKSRRPAEPWVTRWHAPVPIKLPATGPVTVTDIMGNSQTFLPKAGVVSLSLTGSPIYVQGLSTIPIKPNLW